MKVQVPKFYILYENKIIAKISTMKHKFRENTSKFSDICGK